MIATKSYFRRLFLLGAILALAGCMHETAVVEPPPLEVVVSQPIRENIVDWDTYTGTVEAKENVEVRARVHGELKEVSFKEGDEVKEGAKLFIIDSDPYKADLAQSQGQLAAGEAKLKFAEEKIALYKPLAEKGTIAKEELLQAIATKDEALASIATAKGKISENQLNIGFCTITAQIDGRVGQALLTKGNMVNSSGGNNLLATIVSVDPMYVYFYVNERALLNYQRVTTETAKKAGKVSKAEIPAELARLSDAGFPFKGTIDFVDNRVDPATGSVKVRARFDNPKGPSGGRSLTSGLFARIRVAIADPYPAILVADRAILTDQSLKYVLVVNKAKNNTVERRDVTVSNRLQPDGLRAVEAGLNGDEWVIVEGVNRARPGITVNPKDAPMPRIPTADSKNGEKKAAVP